MCECAISDRLKLGPENYFNKLLDKYIAEYNSEAFISN